jgi:arylsulfatase A-like enzyme
MSHHTSQPDIVFILADDLGWGDLSCYGRPDYRTPVLDGLAKQGVRLTHAYANSSTCSPTRVALMTGRYQHRLPVGLEEPILPGSPLGLPPEHPTLPGLLREQGYATALVGKWHLGWMPHFGPLKSGYDEFFGAMGGELDYFRHTATTGLGSGEAEGLYEGDAIIQRTGYTTDLFTERAIDILERPVDKPLFMSLHYTAPHWPWEGPNDIAESRRLRNLVHYDGGSLAVFAEMVRHLDASVGKVLDAIERRGKADNTIVVFTSDNGGERFSYMWPFVGEKGDLNEGGLRVPAMVRWPAVLPAGMDRETPCMSMDWLPTLTSAAGLPPVVSKPLDGVDLLPMLKGECVPEERALYWRTRDQGAVRQGPWKYLTEGPMEFLFNLVDDPREQANLKLREVERFETLKRQYAEWQQAMLPYAERQWPGIRAVKDKFRSLAD